jgi:hypothetical protein
MLATAVGVHIHTLVSLLVVAAVLLTSVAVSLLKPVRQDAETGDDDSSPPETRPSTAVVPPPAA